MGMGQYKLSAIGVQKNTKKGKCSDGVNNLYLEIKITGSKSWIFRYPMHGKRKEMGLGPYPAVGLKEAREEAAVLYKAIKADPMYDPIIERKKAVTKNKLEQQENLVTFKWCAEQFIEAKSPEWNNVKSLQQWTNTLTTYAFPVIADYPVKEVNTELIMRVLKPIWTTKTETATRVRGRIENILSWAAVQGYRGKDNPALWKGHLENLLAKSKTKQG